MDVVHSMYCIVHLTKYNCKVKCEKLKSITFYKNVK